MGSLDLVPHGKTKERIDRCITIHHPTVLGLSPAVYIDDQLWRIAVFDSIATAYTGKAYFLLVLCHRYIQTGSHYERFFFATGADYIDIISKVAVGYGVWI